jgi:hypothetical protein
LQQCLPTVPGAEQCEAHALITLVRRGCAFCVPLITKYISRASNASFATVLVGPKQARFVVHESLLIHYSEFFRAALTGRFKEAEEKAVTLEEAEPAVFGFCADWLYNRYLPSKETDDDPETIEAFYDERSPYHETVTKTYMFGDEKGCQDLRKAAINLLFADFVIHENMLSAGRKVEHTFQ